MSARAKLAGDITTEEFTTIPRRRTKDVDTAKIAKLIRMLNSDRRGEVVAAVAALKRALAGAGKDLHDLADAAARRFQQPAAQVMPSWSPLEPSPPAPDPFDWDRYEEEAAERRYWDRRYDELRERYARESE